MLFRLPDKINMQSPAPSPAGYGALSGYNRRIIHFFGGASRRIPARKGAVLYTRRVLEHTWIPLLFAPFREDAPPRCQRWAGALLGRVSAYITLTTILAAFMFPDDGRCESILDKDKCVTDASVMTHLWYAHVQMGLFCSRRATSVSRK